MEPRDQIIRDLHALGVRRGDTILMHSSMKSLGTDRTPEYVLDAIQDAVGDTGTLALPALSYATVNRENPFWDYYETPVCVGLLPETFRHLPGVLRSISPTHSVSARGAGAASLVAGQEEDDTPVGAHSPYRKLPELGGKILMLGCGMGPMTFMHGVEEAAPAPYVFWPEPWLYHMTDAQGRKYDKLVYRHGINRFGAQRYARAASLLKEGEITRGTVLAAEAFLVDAAALMRVGTETIRRDPYHFLELHPGVRV